MSTTTILVILLVLAALALLGLVVWRALERREETPEPRRGVLAVDLRDRDPGDPDF